MCNRYDRPVRRSPGSRASTRHGREFRGPLLPQNLPGWRSRSERFDMAVLEAYEPIERQWQDRLAKLDVAVDEIPRIAPRDPTNVQFPPEVVADGPIALARLIPAGVDVRFLGFVPDADLSAEAFPHMAVIETTVAGFPARLFRVSFTGELGFEVNVPARHGLALWEKLMEAGQQYGIGRLRIVDDRFIHGNDALAIFGMKA